MRTIWLVVLLLTAASFSSCGGDGSDAGREPLQPTAGTGVVFGTVLDLASGAPAAGVEVSVPGGKSTRTDSEGRFQLGGIPVGTEGEVRARADDGREAVNPLLPLGSERREIVMHLPH